MTRIRQAAVILAVVAPAGAGCAGLPGTARSAARPEPGQRVRVTVPTARPPSQTGTLVSLTSDTIVLRAAEADRLAFPLAAVTSVERSHGVRGHALDGAVYGGQVGLIAVLLGFAAGQWIAGDAQSLAVFAGCMAGGAVIGAAVRTEDWRRVPMHSAHAGLALFPAGRLAVRPRFTVQH
jgi:hypothetical protein